MKTARFSVYRDEGGAWRWRLLAANNRIIADSGEGYSRQRDRLSPERKAPVIGRRVVRAAALVARLT